MTCLPPELHTRTVCWRSESLHDTPVLLRRSHPEEPCGIFHTPIADVHVPGLGQWLENATDAANAADYDAAQLPCGHVFATSALAVHCVSNDMRCPVCRRGPTERAQISSMAAAMQPALLNKKLCMQHTLPDDDLDLDLNVEALARDFRFEIYMQWSPTVCASSDLFIRLDTPVFLKPDAQHEQHYDAYDTHRSFQRRLNMKLHHMLTGAHIMCLSLTHPLMPEPVRSAMFDKHALLACAASGTRIPLSRGFGFVQPVASDAGIHLALHLNTSYICMLCVQTMVDWTTL